MAEQRQKWADGLYQPSRFKVLYGGRLAGKTRAMARALVERCSSHRTEVVLVTQNVVYRADFREEFWAEVIDGVDGKGCWYHYRDCLSHKDGSVIRWASVEAALSEQSGSDIYWGDNAHQLGIDSLVGLSSRIVPGQELWLSFNSGDNPVTRAFCRADMMGLWRRYLIYADNAFFTVEMDAQRLADREALSAEEYAAVWLGREGGFVPHADNRPAASVGAGALSTASI